MISFPENDPSGWFDHLKPYQKNHMAHLGKEHDEMKAAELWLSACGPHLTKKDETKPDFKTFITELKKILTSHPDYKSVEQAFAASPKKGKMTFINVIAEALAKKFNHSAILMAPPIALILSAIATVGLENWLTLQGETPPESPKV